MASKDSTTKVCTTCQSPKDLVEFCKCKGNKDGLQAECKSCKKEYLSVYKKTKNGVASMIYSGQKTSSKQRNDPLPDYSKELFKFWLFSQPEFHRLFELWEASGYLKMEKPSCDRIDDYKPYTLDNLQIITWMENLEKSFFDIKNGINNKLSKAVIQFDLDGNIVTKHHSIQHASRASVTNRGNIFSCCIRKRLTAGGFKWSYA